MTLCQICDQWYKYQGFLFQYLHFHALITFFRENKHQNILGFDKFLNLSNTPSHILYEDKGFFSEMGIQCKNGRQKSLNLVLDHFSAIFNFSCLKKCCRVAKNLQKCIVCEKKFISVVSYSTLNLLSHFRSVWQLFAAPRRCSK